MKAAADCGRQHNPEEEARVEKRRLIGCCGVAVLAVLAARGMAEGKAGAVDSSRLVREVVYNELHDHDTHGYWRYWIERRTAKATLMQEQVETAEGPIQRLELANGRPLDEAARADEDRRLEHLLNSPSEQAQHRKEYAEDERRIGRILALLPEAFLYEPAVVEGGNYHLRFRPNPDYPVHTIESRIFHAMAGDLWISVQSKHLVKLEGKLQENVDFGYGLLGRLYKDGWFRLERTRATNAAGQTDWKTERLEVHMQGRAMLFKTIARETSEVRSGFRAVPQGLTLQQAASLMGTADVAQVRQASFNGMR